MGVGAKERRNRVTYSVHRSVHGEGTGDGPVGGRRPTVAAAVSIGIK